MSSKSPEVPEADADLAGLDSDRLSSSQEARPVPVLYGRNRVAGTFISKIFNVRSSPKKSGKSKGAGGSPLTGTEYYASWAMAVAMGRVSELRAIIWDGKEVWSGDLEQNNYPLYVDVTITGRGVMRFYWGEIPSVTGCATTSGSAVITHASGVFGFVEAGMGVEGPGIPAGAKVISVQSTQQFTLGVNATATASVTLTFNLADPHLNDATLKQPSFQDHPPYKGLCYAVFKAVYLGLQKPQPPNVEFVIERYPTEHDWISSGEAKVNSDCNVPAAIYDILVNNLYGLGIPRARFQETDGGYSIDEALDVLCAEDIGVSPVLTSRVTARQLIADLLAYVDAYPYLGEDGRLSIRLVRQNTPASTLSLGEADIIDEPDVDTTDWGAGRSRTVVTFSNRDVKYKDATAAWRDPSGYAAAGESSLLTLQRPFATRQQVARQLAASAGAAAALPKLGFKIKIRKAAAATAFVGQRVLLTYAPLGFTALECRITEMTLGRADSRSVSLALRVERSWLNQSHYGTYDDPANDQGETAPAAPAFQTVIELPYDLSLSNRGRQVISFLPLVSRSGEFSTSYRFWWKDIRAPASQTYALLASNNAFAVHGKIVGGYTDVTEKIDTRTGMLVEINSDDDDVDTLSLDQALSDTTLVFVGSEIMSVYQATLHQASPLQIRIHPIRARYDTRRQAHAANADVWIMARDAVSPVFQRLSRRALQESFKVTTLIGEAETALASATAMTITPVNRVSLPTPPASLRKTVSMTALPGETRWSTYAGAGATLYFRWNGTDQQADDFFVQWRRVAAPAWVSTEDYEVYDEVSKGRRIYLCQLANTNIQPEVTSGWQSYWTLKQDVQPPGTLLEFRTTGGVVKKTITLGRAVEVYKVTASTLNTWFAWGGAYTDFVLRAYGYLKNLQSTFYTDLTVYKV
jgi:hypothetical protein